MLEANRPIEQLDGDNGLMRRLMGVLELYRGFNFGAHLLLDGCIRTVPALTMAVVGARVSKKVHVPERYTFGQMARNLFSTKVFSAEGRKIVGQAVIRYLQNDQEVARIVNRNRIPGMVLLTGGAGATAAQGGATVGAILMRPRIDDGLRFRDDDDLAERFSKFCAATRFLSERLLEGLIEPARDLTVVGVIAHLLPGSPRASLSLSRDNWKSLFEAMLYASDISAVPLDYFWAKTTNPAALLNREEVQQIINYHQANGGQDFRIDWLRSHFKIPREVIDHAFKEIGVMVQPQRLTIGTDVIAREVALSIHPAGAFAAMPGVAQLVMSGVVDNVQIPDAAMNVKLSMSTPQAMQIGLQKPILTLQLQKDLGRYSVQPELRGRLENMLVSIKDGQITKDWDSVWLPFLDGLIGHDRDEAHWSAMLSVRDASGNNLLHCLNMAFQNEPFKKPFEWLIEKSVNDLSRGEILSRALLEQNLDGDTPLHILDNSADGLIHSYINLLLICNDASLFRLLTITNNKGQLFIEIANQYVLNALFGNREVRSLLLNTMLRQLDSGEGGYVVSADRDTIWHCLARVPMLFIAWFEYLRSTDQYQNQYQKVCSCLERTNDINVKGDNWLHVFARRGHNIQFEELLTAFPKSLHLKIKRMLWQLNYNLETAANLWYKSNPSAFKHSDDLLFATWAQVDFSVLHNASFKRLERDDSNAKLIVMTDSGDRFSELTVSLDQLDVMVTCTSNAINLALQDGKPLDFIIFTYLLLYQQATPDKILEFFSGKMSSLASNAKGVAKAVSDLCRLVMPTEGKIITNYAGNNWLHLLLDNVNAEVNWRCELLKCFLAESKTGFQRSALMFNNAGNLPIGFSLRDGTARVESDDTSLVSYDQVQRTFLQQFKKSIGEEQSVSKALNEAVKCIPDEQVPILAKQLWTSGHQGRVISAWLSGRASDTVWVSSSVLDNVRDASERSSRYWRDFFVGLTEKWWTEEHGFTRFGEFVFGELPTAEKVDFLRCAFTCDEYSGYRSNFLEQLLYHVGIAGLGAKRIRILMDLLDGTLTLFGADVIRVLIDEDARSEPKWRYLEIMLTTAAIRDYGDIINRFFGNVIKCAMVTNEHGYSLGDNYLQWRRELLSIWARNGIFDLTHDVIDGILTDISSDNWGPEAVDYFKKFLVYLLSNEGISHTAAMQFVVRLVENQEIRASLSFDSFRVLIDMIGFTGTNDAWQKSRVVGISFALSRVIDISHFTSIGALQERYQTCFTELAKLALGYDDDSFNLMSSGFEVLTRLYFGNSKSDWFVKLSENVLLNPLIKLCGLVERGGYDRGVIRYIELVKQVIQLDKDKKLLKGMPKREGPGLWLKLVEYKSGWSVWSNGYHYRAWSEIERELNRYLPSDVAHGEQLSEEKVETDRALVRLNK